MSTAIAKSAVRVVTSEYEWAHGRKPSGIGAWWFSLPNASVTFHGRYSEAKRQAVALAASLGHYEVRVGA